MRRANSRFASFALVAMTAVFLACEESPTSPHALNDSATVLQLSADAGNPVVRSARGSGHHQGPNIGGVEVGWRVFTFNAIQRQDGTTTGNVRYDVHDQGDPAVTHKVKGEVFCMVDLGDGMIAIGAQGTQRTPYDQPPIFAPFGDPLLPAATLPDDWGLFFVVRDNGEGPGATGPDEFTGVVNTVLEGNLGFGQIEVIRFICANPLALGFNAELAEAFFNDVEAGNIQVSNN